MLALDAAGNLSGACTTSGMILLIEGYSTDRGRSARLMRNDEPVN